MKYRIYAGLSGSFGGAVYQKTVECDSEKEAYEAAYEIAVEIYQSYEGRCGIMSWEDCRRSLIKMGYEDDEDIVNDIYQEELESWLSYYVEPAKDE